MDGIKLKTELKELLEHMQRILLLYHEVLAYFQRFKLENRDLLESFMSPEES